MKNIRKEQGKKAEYLVKLSLLIDNNIVSIILGNTINNINIYIDKIGTKYSHSLRHGFRNSLRHSLSLRHSHSFRHIYRIIFKL